MAEQGGVFYHAAAGFKRCPMAEQGGVYYHAAAGFKRCQVAEQGGVFYHAAAGDCGPPFSATIRKANHGDIACIPYGGMVY